MLVNIFAKIDFLNLSRILLIKGNTAKKKAAPEKEPPVQA